MSRRVKQESFFGEKPKKKNKEEVFFEIDSGDEESDLEESEEEIEIEGDEEEEELPLDSEEEESEGERFAELLSFANIGSKPYKQTEINPPSLSSTNISVFNPIGPPRIGSLITPAVPIIERREPITTITSTAIPQNFIQSKPIEVRGVNPQIEPLEKAALNIPSTIIPVKQNININAPIDTLLVKDEYEDDKKFAIRKSLAHTIKEKTKISSQAAINLSYVLMRKAFFGVSYNPELERLIDLLIAEII